MKNQILYSILLSLSLSLSLAPPHLKIHISRSLSRSPRRSKKMSRATTELDFLGLEKKQTNNAPKPKFQKFLDRRRSFREIQGAISKIDPEIIKSLLASGANHTDSYAKSCSVPSTPREHQPQIPISPVHASLPTRSSTEVVSGTVPMTIFYNGVVSVFQVSSNKAEEIMKVAKEADSKKDESSSMETDISIFPSQGESHCKGFSRSVRRD